MPQYNLYAKMGFTALARMVCLVLNQVNISRVIHYKLCGKVSKSVSKLDQLIVIEINGVKKTRFNHYTGVSPPWVKHMRTFGKAVTVRTGKDDKVGDHEITMMFLGYAENREGNCYIVFNPHRSSVVETHDVTWLHCMYYGRINTSVTTLGPNVVIEADSQRD